METNEIKEVLKNLVGIKMPTQTGTWLMIMAYADNHFMARFKGCVPFVETVRGMAQRIQNKCVPEYKNKF